MGSSVSDRSRFSRYLASCRSKGKCRLYLHKMWQTQLQLLLPSPAIRHGISQQTGVVYQRSSRSCRNACLHVHAWGHLLSPRPMRGSACHSRVGAMQTAQCTSTFPWLGRPATLRDREITEVCCQGQAGQVEFGSLPSTVAAAGLSPGSLWSESRCRLHFCSGHWGRQCILDKLLIRIPRGEWC